MNQPAASIRELFESALAQPATGRAAWLAEHCADSTRRDQVNAMLRHADGDDEPLFASLHSEFSRAESRASRDDAEVAQGRVYGDFRALRRIGDGGMSVVYEGERIDADFEQRVAIKLLRQGVHSDWQRALFRRERQVLAALDHPNIARLIDGGVDADGTPYLVMEFVAGQPITHHCAAAGLGLRQRLALCVDMCRAVDAAHRVLIVHRDIKPSNVLVTADDVVKLLDFGIAKLLESDAPATRATQVLLTPGYAAPEQYSGGLISTATDVYALGVVLHEMLLGSRPGLDAPTRPSLVAAQMNEDAAPLGLHSRTLPRLLAGDLDNIILKAIDTDPQRRYHGAGAMADDIERHLAGEPVLAHPPSRWYRTRKFAQRHRGAVSVTIALAAGLIASLAIAVLQGREAMHQATVARAAESMARIEAERANATRDFLLAVFEAAQQSLPKGQRPSPKQLAQAAARRIEQNQVVDATTRADLLSAFAAISTSMSEYADALSAYQRAAELVADDRQQRRRWLSLTMHQASSLRSLDQIDAAVALAEPLVAELRAQTDAIAIEGLAAWSSILTSAARFDDSIAMADAANVIARQVLLAQSRDARFRALLPGWARANAGRFKEAEAPLERALSEWRNATTPKDAEFAAGLEALSMVKYQIGKKNEARTLLEESLAFMQTIFDPPHESLADTLESLAVLEYEQGNLNAAADYVDQASAMFTQLFGAEHASVISARLTAATISSDRSGPSAAITGYREVTALCTRARQDDTNPDCARAWQNMSNALAHLDRFDEALQANQRGMDQRKAIYGEAHAEYASSLTGRGAIHASMDNDAEAMNWFDRARAIHHANGIDNNLAVATIERNRAISLRALKRHGEALTALEAATTIYSKYAPNDALRGAEMHGLRALILADFEQPDQARPEARKALQLDSALSKLNADDAAQIKKIAGPLK